MGGAAPRAPRAPRPFKLRPEGARWGRGAVEGGPVGGGLDKDAPGNAAELSPQRRGAGGGAGASSASPVSSPLPSAGCSSAGRAAVRKRQAQHPPPPGKSPLCAVGDSRLRVQAEAEVPKVIWRWRLVEKGVLLRQNWATRCGVARRRVRKDEGRGPEPRSEVAGEAAPARTLRGRVSPGRRQEQDSSHLRQ